MKNREIKFRVWFENDSVSEMHYFDNIQMNSAAAISLWDKIGFENAFPEKNNIEQWQKNAVWMQYTGLKDKNGKEIYEGDIVNQEKLVSVGKYERTIGIVKYKSIKFTCECIGDWLGSNTDLNGNAIIIGNIYENPELA